MTSVLIADDQALVRDGLRLILDSQDDLVVVGEAGDGHEAVARTVELKPDVVLMDIRMPGMDGLEATRRLTADSPARVVILTTFDHDEYVIEAIKAGACGFLLKSSPRQHLLHAVRTASDGGALLDPGLTTRLLDKYLRGRGTRTASDTHRLERLTTRESEVLREMARGRSNAEIAKTMYIGETTVKSHVAHILQKLELRDRIHAVVFSYETGVINPGECSTSEQPPL